MAVPYWRVGLGGLALAAALFALPPPAKAQFLGLPWFDNSARPARPHVPAKPAPPAGDDLPPIEAPKESLAPPPPDDRPYDDKLLRLTEILGAVHYLRELCGAQEGQLWRDQMEAIVKDEGTTAVRRAKLVNSFNDGYRGYRRTYRTCTPSATLAVTRFTTEGSQIAEALAKSSQVASRAPEKPAETKPEGAGSAAQSGAAQNGQDKNAHNKVSQGAQTSSAKSPADAAAPQPGGKSRHKRAPTQDQGGAPDAAGGGW